MVRERMERERMERDEAREQEGRPQSVDSGVAAPSLRREIPSARGI